jgi:hypothetical protein
VRRFIEVKQPVIQENWFVKLNLGVGTAGGFSGKKEKPYFSLQITSHRVLILV